MTRLRAAFAVIFLAAGVIPLSAQASDLTYDHRVEGDRALTVMIGPFFPQAFQTFTGSFSSSNLFAVGGTLGLGLDFYLDEHWSMGVALRGSAAFGVNGDTLFMVPVTFRSTYEFKSYPFSFPVGMGAGINFTSYKTSTNLDFIFQPSVGAFWNMSSSWSFGITATEWIVLEPYLYGGSVPSSDGRIGYFVDPSVSAIYHF
jgi:hypothetical protein